MAEVIISPLLRMIFDKLASPLLVKLQFSGDNGKKFEKLRATLPVIRAVIEDAEEQQHKDKKVMVWLKELKDVAYDIDDLLDELTTQLLQRKTKKNKVPLTCLALKPFSNYYVMPSKLTKIQARLDDIARDMSAFQLRDRVVYKRSETLERRQTGPYVDESQVCGRRKDVDVMVNMLLSTTTASVSVIPIVGMGGIGKTTFAQLAYNDPRVASHFDLRIWVSVYDNNNMRKIINEILESATKQKHDSSQIGVLQSQLFESLCGKRYLLILDDVWTEDQDEWEKLRYPLSSGADGSKILITTRSKRVASIMRTSQPYTLEALSEDECWTLFKQRAFEFGEEQSYPNLVPIGKQIVKKCNGVPLVAKILGSFMRFKRQESEWLHVQKSELWNLDEGENRILSALRLSYNHLPSHLKRCFAYCSTLPKNFEMSKDKLIRLWIAEGLIQSSGDSDTYSTKKMEDTGNEYFNDLLLMSFFEAVNGNDNSNTTEFKMHDFIHDLAKFVAGNESLMLCHDDASIKRAQAHHSSDLNGNLAQTRHASIFCNFLSCWVPDALYAAKKLRTLRFFSPTNDPGKVIPTIVAAFTNLRELDLSGCGIRSLHKSIGGLIYLRYIDLSNTLLETLPSTICNLCNLQTLDLSGCYNLMKLPKGMTRLIKLRHLILNDCTRLTRTPASIRTLRNLQTLPVFIVGPTFEESLFQLVHLDLRGELKIKHLENAGSIVPHLCLEHKQLHFLGLSWGNDEAKLDSSSSTQPVEGRHTNHSCADAEILLNCLKPNDNLRKLFLNGYSGVMFPQWMNNVMLPNLTELVLNKCRRCEKLPTLGQLPLLKVLNMQGLDAVVNIGCEFYGEEGRGAVFPSLEQLTLKDFPNLQTWEVQDSRDAVTCLQRLTIAGCPRLKTMPRFPSLQHLELRNCNAGILRSAAELNSLSTLIVDSIAELLYLPQGLLQNSPLTSLTISSCHQLSSLPWDLKNLVALKSLTLRWCEELSSLPQQIRSLTSLEYLEIMECHSLVSLPEEGIRGLRSLRSLSIENCNNLSSLPKGIKYLTALEHLTVMYCPNLPYLPDELQHLSALRNLNILSCQELVSLPEGLKYVNTLQNLEICSCPGLVDLPDWIENLNSLRSLAIAECQNIKYLPKGLERLNALQHLSIRDCPDLEKRCKERGEDLSHIPYTYIRSSASQHSAATQCCN